MSSSFKKKEYPTNYKESSDSDTDSGDDLVFQSKGPAINHQPKQERVLKIWKDFMGIRGVSEEESLRRYRHLPTKRALGEFIGFMVERKRKSTITQSVHTIKGYYRSLVPAYEKITRTHFDKERRQNPLKHIVQELPRKFGSSTGKKRKYDPTVTDLDIPTRTLWRNNDYHVKHDRMRAQLTWFLLLHAYTGARAGTFIEGYFHKGTGKCLTYKDVRLHVYWRANGTPGLMLELTERFTKANPDPMENRLVKAALFELRCYQCT